MRNIEHMFKGIQDGVKKYLNEVIDNPHKDETLKRSIIERLKENFELLHKDCTVETIAEGTHDISFSTDPICQFRILRENKIEAVYYLSIDQNDNTKYNLTKMDLSDQMKGLLNNIREKEKENSCAQ